LKEPVDLMEEVEYLILIEVEVGDQLYYCLLMAIEELEALLSDLTLGEGEELVELTWELHLKLIWKVHLI
jgi:hypothetical protein